MFTSFIVLVLVLAAGALFGSAGPPWAPQPAMVARANDAALRHRYRTGVWAAVHLDPDDDTSIVMDSLRALGLVRRGIEQPEVGRKAYVRLWERVRALIVLAAIIISIGFAVAATIGIIVLAAGFLLEQAIS